MKRMVEADPGPGEGGGIVPQPADVSKVATGDQAKTAAPPPRLPGKWILQDILGKLAGGREP